METYPPVPSPSLIPTPTDTAFTGASFDVGLLLIVVVALVALAFILMFVGRKKVTD